MLVGQLKPIRKWIKRRMLSTNSQLAIAILAAGKGKRMGNPDVAKVLTELHGAPLIQYVLDQTKSLPATGIVVIVGHQKQAVKDFVATYMPSVSCVSQDEQLGTGHAVLQAKELLDKPNMNVLILSGDVPLLTAQTLQGLIDFHNENLASATVLTTTVADPTGYGRIITSADGEFLRIVEQKDATDTELAVSEINSGVYVVKADSLFESLTQVGNVNAQGEYYLTDIIKILKQQGSSVMRYHTPNFWEVQGINTPMDLQAAASAML